MARYIFSNGRDHGAEGYAFAGFDEIDGETVEATHASVLGRLMPDHAAKIFRALEAGEWKRVASGGFYFREW